jgi:hypothetical protein
MVSSSNGGHSAKGGGKRHMDEQHGQRHKVLNFVLHESMQTLCGIALTQYFGGKDEFGKPILPGMQSYNPALPWVSKIRLTDGTIAGDLFVYVNDARITGATKGDCWAAMHQAGSIFNSIGIMWK